MATYILCYDLHTPGQKYECIEQKLEKYGTKWKFQQSNWIIETSDSASTIRDLISSCLDKNDKTFVAKLSGEAAWRGYSDKAATWLKKRLKK